MLTKGFQGELKLTKTVKRASLIRQKRHDTAEHETHWNTTVKSFRNREVITEAPLRGPSHTSPAVSMVFAGWMLRADDSDTAMGTEK